MGKSYIVISPGNDRRNILKYSKKSAGILSLLLLFNSIGMTGCGQTVAESGHVSISMTGMENTPVINYTVPTLTPNVLVDQQGYAADGGDFPAGGPGNRGAGI